MALRRGSAPWLCADHRRLRRDAEGSLLAGLQQREVLPNAGAHVRRQAALEALVALALLLSRTLGLVSLALELGLSNSQGAWGIKATAMRLPPEKQSTTWTSSCLGRVPGSRLLLDKYQIGLSPRFIAFCVHVSPCSFTIHLSIFKLCVFNFKHCHCGNGGAQRS